MQYNIKNVLKKHSRSVYGPRIGAYFMVPNLNPSDHYHDGHLDRLVSSYGNWLICKNLSILLNYYPHYLLRCTRYLWISGIPKVLFQTGDCCQQCVKRQ